MSYKQMSKPDACPENDIVSLQVITLVDAERLYQLYVDSPYLLCVKEI